MQGQIYVSLDMQLINISNVKQCHLFGSGNQVFQDGFMVKRENAIRYEFQLSQLQHPPVPRPKET